MKFQFLLALISVSLCACASLEPEPCTAEWVEWKTQNTLAPFAQTHKGTVQDLVRFSKNLEDPGPLTLITLPSKLEDLTTLAEAFKLDVLPELQSAAAQCETAKPFITAFSSFLEEEGVDQEMIALLTTLSIFLTPENQS